jgi:small subunit ribosomal protein S8
MSFHDPIADLIVRVKNGIKARMAFVAVQHSNIKEGIVKILKDQGYIRDYEVVNLENKKKDLKIFLKYKGKTPCIRDFKQISKPSLRVYATCQEIPTVLNGLGVALISTSQGLMTSKEALSSKIGGEVIAHI